MRIATLLRAIAVGTADPAKTYAQLQEARNFVLNPDTLDTEYPIVELSLALPAMPVDGGPLCRPLPAVPVARREPTGDGDHRAPHRARLLRAYRGAAERPASSADPVTSRLSYSAS